MYVTSGKICDGQCRNEAFKYGSVSEWTPSEDFFFFFWLIRFLFWKSNMDSVRISCLDRQWSFLESWACSWSNSTVVVEANRKKKKSLSQCVTGVQSWMQSVERSGLSTQPRGFPLVSVTYYWWRGFTLWKWLQVFLFYFIEPSAREE